MPLRIGEASHFHANYGFATEMVATLCKGSGRWRRLCNYYADFTVSRVGRLPNNINQDKKKTTPTANKSCAPVRLQYDKFWRPHNTRKWCRAPQKAGAHKSNFTPLWLIQPREHWHWLVPLLHSNAYCGVYYNARWRTCGVRSVRGSAVAPLPYSENAGVAA